MRKTWRRVCFAKHPEAVSPSGASVPAFGQVEYKEISRGIGLWQREHGPMWWLVTPVLMSCSQCEHPTKGQVSCTLPPQNWLFYSSTVGHKTILKTHLWLIFSIYIVVDLFLLIHMLSWTLWLPSYFGCSPSDVLKKELFKKNPCYSNIKCVNTIRSEKLREQEDTEQKHQKKKNNCHNKKI